MEQLLLLPVMLSRPYLLVKISKASPPLEVEEEKAMAEELMTLSTIFSIIRSRPNPPDPKLTYPNLDPNSE